jgi:protein involved in polysaccharide export with SLBB domain
MITLSVSHYLRRLCVATVIAAGTLAISAQDTPPASPPPAPAAAPAAADPAKPVNFRAPSADLKGDETAIQPGEAPRGSASALQELLDRRESLENEIRVGRGRLDASRRRAEVLKSLGQSEQAERLQGEVRDWEARMRNSREQLAQVEEELNRVQQKPAEETATTGDEVILPGNNLDVVVTQDSSFNGRYQVRRGGYILMPTVGRVIVAGKTVPNAEAAIRKALQATQLRRATVFVERFEGVSDEAGPLIFLSGEFRNPRPYRIPQGTAPTLVSVILSAGGVSERADLTNVKVMRMAQNRSVVEHVNVKRILEAQNPIGLEGDLTLTEGDVVVVPAGSTNLVYVTGRVKKPGSYRVGDGEKLTGYGAILQSGGFDHFADRKDVHILRSMPDGTKAKLPLNVRDLEKGRRPDVILQPNDIVVVPEKWFSW